MEGVWPIIFLGVVLKIPVFFGIWLVWWAAKGYDEELSDEAPGSGEHGFNRWRRPPKRPRGPRRGDPHGGGALAAPGCPPGGRRRTAPPALPQPALSGHARRGHSSASE